MPTTKQEHYRHLMANQLPRHLLCRYKIKYEDHPLILDNLLQGHHRTLISFKLDHSNIRESFQTLSERITSITFGSYRSFNSILSSLNYGYHRMHYSCYGINNCLIITCEQQLNWVGKYIHYLYKK